MNTIRSPRFLGAIVSSALLLLVGCDDGAGAGAEPGGTVPPQESGTAGGSYGEPAPADPQGPPPGGDPAAPPGDPAAPAQDPMGPGAPQGDAGEITPSELETFSVIQLELMQLQQSLQQRAQAGEDPETLQHEMDRKALEIVEESEMSVGRFEAIARQAQGDAELRQRIESQMREQAGG